MKVKDLKGTQLDYWVAKAIMGETGDVSIEKIGRSKVEIVKAFLPFFSAGHFKSAEFPRWNPSENWQYGGPLIEKYHISLLFWWGGWSAYIEEMAEESFQRGDCALIAVCRAVVASVYGDEVPSEKKIIGIG